MAALLLQGNSSNWPMRVHLFLFLAWYSPMQRKEEIDLWIQYFCHCKDIQQYHAWYTRKSCSGIIQEGSKAKYNVIICRIIDQKRSSKSYQLKPVKDGMTLDGENINMTDKIQSLRLVLRNFLDHGDILQLWIYAKSCKDCQCKSCKVCSPLNHKHQWQQQQSANWIVI